MYVPRTSKRLSPPEPAVRSGMTWAGMSEAVGVGECSGPSAYLGSCVLDGDLHVAIGILLSLEHLQSRVDLDEESSALAHCLVCISQSVHLDRQYLSGIGREGRLTMATTAVGQLLLKGILEMFGQTILKSVLSAFCNHTMEPDVLAPTYLRVGAGANTKLVGVTLVGCVVGFGIVKDAVVVVGIGPTRGSSVRRRRHCDRAGEGFSGEGSCFGCVGYRGVEGMSLIDPFDGEDCKRPIQERVCLLITLRSASIGRSPTGTGSGRRGRLRLLVRRVQDPWRRQCCRAWKPWGRASDWGWSRGPECRC